MQSPQLRSYILADVPLSRRDAPGLGDVLLPGFDPAALSVVCDEARLPFPLPDSDLVLRARDAELGDAWVTQHLRECADDILSKARCFDAAGIAWTQAEFSSLCGGCVQVGCPADPLAATSTPVPDASGLVAGREPLSPDEQTVRFSVSVTAGVGGALAIGFANLEQLGAVNLETGLHACMQDQSWMLVGEAFYVDGVPAGRGRLAVPGAFFFRY